MIAGADCAALNVAPFPHTPLKLPFKSFYPLIDSREVVLWDMSSPSPQVAGLLNKATFSFLPILVSRILAFKLQAAKTEFGSKITKGKV